MFAVTVLHRKHGVRDVFCAHSEAGESTGPGVHSAADDRRLQVHRQLVSASHLISHHYGPSISQYNKLSSFSFHAENVHPFFAVNCLAFANYYTVAQWLSG